MMSIPFTKTRGTYVVDTLRERLIRLYGEDAGRICMDRLTMMIGRYGVGPTAPPQTSRWSQHDAVLITYGDMIYDTDERPLALLRRFLVDWLQHAFSTIHILPFFPYSSDDGFSVINYRDVNPQLGSWRDIARIAENFKIMADLVLNHCSRHSPWVKDFVAGVAPFRNFFIEVDPDTDLSQVVRPRSKPLLTPIDTRHGRRYLWTTFSDDQIDLNFANPDVLFEFLDILFLYINQGIRVLRLDAIAYLWKEIGTSCIHLPQTHEVVRLFRDVCEIVAPDLILITETNVPHEENISYFNDGNEAHMVYQFTLPPLLLHTLQAGNATHLTRWAAELDTPPDGCTYLNFTASHDGIGVRPLEGILDDQQLADIITRVKNNGGYVSTKTNPDGSDSPYELNITYLDALVDPDHPDDELLLRRFLCSQTIPLSLQGIPAIYFHSLVGTRNWHEGVEHTGHYRTINRYKWLYQDLNATLADNASLSFRIFTEIIRMLRIRGEHPAFHPDAKQQILNVSAQVFALQRSAPDDSEILLAFHNVTADTIDVNLTDQQARLDQCPAWRDILAPQSASPADTLTLQPYQTAWLIGRPPAQ